MKRLLTTKYTVGLISFLLVAGLVYLLVESIGLAPGNRLGAEKSMYLRQHADNPIDWWPWSEAPFQEARSKQKMVFLSIGYATCHWCHVMERESFADEDVASILNKNFVAIKVDREERPDIDSFYMRACRLITNKCGWPLTVILTANKQPIYAGSYFPKNTRDGQIGLMQLLPKLIQGWQQNRSKIISLGKQTIKMLRESIKVPATSEAKVKDAFLSLQKVFDAEQGGFGFGHKFPLPVRLSYLLDYFYFTGNKEALNMAETTLQSIVSRGLWDPIGYGFHRYAVDPAWRIPHFEKMLYDQALLTQVYLEAYQITGKKEYQAVVRKTLDYVSRKLQAPDGGFYSAQDAEWETVEGASYLWHKDELVDVLGKDRGSKLIQLFGIQDQGNTNASIHGRPKANLFYLDRFKNLKDALTGSSTLAKLWQEARPKLLNYREQRSEPRTDTKILIGWNSLMISAYAKAGRVLGDEDYIQQAELALGYLNKKLRDGNELYHSNNTAIAWATQPDYALFIQALLDVYETNFNPAHIKSAIDLQNHHDRKFSDSKQAGYFMTVADKDSPIVSSKEFKDGVFPAGNSVAVRNLKRLNHLLLNKSFLRKAQDLADIYKKLTPADPLYYLSYLRLKSHKNAGYEIVIAGNPNNQDTKKMLRLVQRMYLPRSVIVFRPHPPLKPPITEIVQYTLPQKSRKGRATAYVCQSKVCKLPITDLAKLEQALSK